MKLNDPLFPSSSTNPTLTDKALGVVGGLVKLMTFQQIKDAVDSVGVDTVVTVEDVLTSTNTANALSAAQGKVLNDALALKAPLANPIFTGTPTAPTPQTEPSLDNSTKLATTEFVNVVANAAVSTANAYADSLLTSVYKFQSTYNPQTTGNFPTTANTVGGVDIAKCFTWVIAGLSGQYTFQGVTVDNGDTLLSLVDNASATVSSDWHITEKNLGYTPENVNNKATNLTLPDDTKYPTTQAVVTALDGYEPELPANVGSVKFLREDRTWQTAPAPVLTETNFAVEKNGQPTYTVTWVLTALTDARTWTIPNTNLDFGNIAKIPAVATPYTTAPMAGTRPQCLGGSSNTFSGGTDVVAIGCTSSTLSGTNVTYINVTGLADSAITWANAIVLGSSYTTLPGEVGGGLNVLTNTTTISNEGAGTYSAVSAEGAVSSSNCVKLALGLSSSAVHEIDFIIQHDNDFSSVGTITGKRRVIAFSDNAGAITVSSVNTPYADFVMGSSTGLAFSVTLDTTNNRLIPTLTATGTIFGVAMQAKVTSYYTKKAA